MLVVEKERKKFRRDSFDNENGVQRQNTCVGVCQGALGELFQGISADGSDEIVVVSSLIPKYSWAYFTPSEEGFSSLQDQRLATPERPKSFRALELFCQSHQVRRPSGYWFFNSDLKVARGMASSTADIVATLRCAANYLNHALGTEEIMQILSKIERSDSVFLDRLALFSSSHHQIIHQFAKIPPLYALYMHERDPVDTDGTKSLLIDFYQNNRRFYRSLYREVEQALGKADLKALCRISSKSAELSNEILPKHNFHKIYEAQSRFSADGVIVAHTGSVVGLLYCQSPDVHIFEQVAKFYKELGGWCQYTEIRA